MLKPFLKLSGRVLEVSVSVLFVVIYLIMIFTI